MTFRSDGAGTVTAKLATTSPQGTTHMCFLVGTKEIGCQDWRSGTFTGKTSQAHANWTVTLRGSAADAPKVDLTVTFQALAPSVKIEHARFDGTAAQETNGINARFDARAAGEVRLVADWGGHPLLYQIDLFDESGGQVSRTSEVRTRKHRPIPTRHFPSRREPGGSCSRTPRRVRDDRPDRHDLVALTPRPRRSPA